NISKRWTSSLEWIIVPLMPLSTAIFVSLLIAGTEANFEDTRCRCVCPSTQYFASASGNGSADDNHRRYYTKPNIKALDCNPQKVVKSNVLNIIDQAHLDAFLANCDCKYESRNTVMLKVVVIFVICVVLVLVTYMLFLMCLDPMLRKQRQSIPYRQHNDEMEENIFARTASNTGVVEGSPSITMRSRGNSGVLERVEAEQNRWMRKVEEQRKNIFTDHTMLN
uniref:Transmembrane protein 9 n=1 Tax=Parascaris univalens TaxID=6257 RepID=A0A915AE41_PARUN